MALVDELHVRVARPLYATEREEAESDAVGTIGQAAIAEHVLVGTDPGQLPLIHTAV